MAPLRDRVIAMFDEAFGTSQPVPTMDGALHRWMLRAADGTLLRLTLDGPEFEHIAHLILSDPAAIDPLLSITMRTTEEAAAVIERIRGRLKLKKE